MRFRLHRRCGTRQDQKAKRGKRDDCKLIKRAALYICACLMVVSVLPVKSGAVDLTEGATTSISGLTDPNLSLTATYGKGNKPSEGSGGNSGTSSWTASGTTINGIVTPGYTSKWRRVTT